MIAENNTEAEIIGVRWLLKENWPEKVASSLVIYMKARTEVDKLRMAGKDGGKNNKVDMGAITWSDMVEGGVLL